MKHPFITDVEFWQSSDAIKALDACGLRAGMNVLDFGCGALYWTLPAAAVADTGTVYAADNNRYIINSATDYIKTHGISNITPLKLADTGLSKFDKPVDFIMYYDMFHCIGTSFLGRIDASIRIFKEFYRILTPGGIFTLALFRELCYVQDPTNGPFTNKGHPRWFMTDYEDAMKRYDVFGLIEKCGFEFVKTVPGAIHFDEIEKRLGREENAELRISDLERRDIMVFIKPCDAKA